MWAVFYGGGLGRPAETRAHCRAEVECGVRVSRLRQTATSREEKVRSSSGKEAGRQAEGLREGDGVLGLSLPLTAPQSVFEQKLWTVLGGVLTFSHPFPCSPAEPRL